MNTLDPNAEDTGSQPLDRDAKEPIMVNPDSHEAVDTQLKASQPVEENYPDHQKDPAPAEEAVFEENEDGAGKAMKWIIPVIVVVLAILWFIMK